ncbi:sialic acid-binding Ig-like lectin 10 [Lacerta agilis]|uniref:sialic acid-binding Ig-like lectin 10 n=1 Tax=Lacerta agilis TaxID=80427 RepID=UPI0014198BF4|nr:sialic acid-binding Ig-like lectin 10 [Lacerta agilis]
MSYPLGVFILGLLSTCLHWEGAQCHPGYNLTVPPEVRVQEGFCIVIPCKFTYPASADTNRVELHGYWYTVRGSSTYRGAVATNDENKQIEYFARNRFLLSGDLEQGDCSLTINNTRKSSDEGAYYFRIEKDIRYSYPNKTFVRVAGRGGQTRSLITTVASHCPVWNLADQRNFTDASRIGVQEGDSIMLFCGIKSNPSANATWVTNSEKTTGWQSPKTNILTISNVQLADRGGYKCHASNTEGETDATFQLYVAYSPRPCEQDNSQCWRDDNGFQCNCSICSYPASRIQWQVNGKNLEGNYSDETMTVTSWNKTEEATSTLYLTGDLVGEQHIICLGTNPGGQIPLKFFVASSGESLKKNIISGLMGALIMFAIVMVIVIILFMISRRYPNDRKPLTASESYAKPLTHVHSELSPDVKRNSLTVPNPVEGNDAPEDQEKFDEFPDEISNDPEELHYASLNFGELKCLPEANSEESKSDYAEIKKV